MSRPAKSKEPAVRTAMARLEQALTNAAASNDRSGELQQRALRMAEALLFAGGDPVKAVDLAAKLPPGADVARVLMALKAKYAGGGVELVETGAGWRFQTTTDLAFLFDESAKPKKLPRAAMETLAVIAYHQPVTRSEIEELRGAALSRGALDLLLELGWVRPRGRRRSPGKPLTYGVTDAFLSHFGLQSLDALPGRDDLLATGLADARSDASFDALAPGEPPSVEEDALDPEVEQNFFVEFAKPEE